MQKPVVSVIMPSLNVAGYIRECIESAINQSIEDIEILCVDAGSTDGTLQILQSYARTDTRVRLIYSDIKSYGYQVNLGMDNACGKYIAVLETDDYLAPDAYEKLVDAAERFDAEYSRGDYCNVYTLSGNKQGISAIHAFAGERREFYNRIIEPKNEPGLYAADYLLWRGIYRADFLKKNNIRLHETPGAAYQDIGFMGQILCHVKRCVYIPDIVYYYRLGRAGSSSRSLNGLYNYRNDYEWVGAILRECGDTRDLLGHYHKMMNSFVGEYRKLLEAADYDTDSAYLAEPFSWFKDEFAKANDEGLLSRAYFSMPLWEALMLLINDPEKYKKEAVRRLLEKRDFGNHIKEYSQKRDIIIFGTGSRGRRAQWELDGLGLTVCGWCDNDSSNWGKEINGAVVHCPKDYIPDHTQSIYFIENANHYKDIERQLCEYGVQKDNIFVNCF